MKTLSKLTRERKLFLRLLRVICQLSRASIRVKHGRLSAFPWRSGTTQGIFSSFFPFKKSFYLTLLLCMYVYVVWDVPCAHAWRSEGHFMESVLFFHVYVGPRDGTQHCTGSKHLGHWAILLVLRVSALAIFMKHWSWRFWPAPSSKERNQRVQTGKWKKKNLPHTRCSFMWKSSGTHQKTARSYSILDAIDQSTKMQCLLLAINR